MFCTFKPRTSMLAGFWVSISVPLLPKWQATIPSSSSLNSCTGKLSRAVLWTGVALQALTPVVQMLPGFGPEWAALPWPSPVPWRAHSTAWVGPKKQPALHYCSPPSWQGRWGWHQGRWSSPRSWSMGQAGWQHTPEAAPGLGSLPHPQQSPWTHQWLFHNHEAWDYLGVAEDVAGPPHLLKTEMWESRKHCVTASPRPLVPGQRVFPTTSALGHLHGSRENQGCRTAFPSRPAQNALVSAGVQDSPHRSGPVGWKGNCLAGWGELYHSHGAG